MNTFKSKPPIVSPFFKLFLNKFGLITTKPIIITDIVFNEIKKLIKGHNATLHINLDRFIYKKGILNRQGGGKSKSIGKRMLVSSNRLIVSSNNKDLLSDIKKLFPHNVLNLILF